MKTPDEIKKALKCYKDGIACYDCPYEQGRTFEVNGVIFGCSQDIAADALAYIEQLEEKQQWISIKDRPPKAGKIFVTDGETVTISNGAWLYRTLDGKIRVPANYGAGLTVTRWMPRPVPPKEDESYE